MTIQTDSRITSEMLTDGLNNTFPYDFPIFKGDNGQKGVEVRFMNDLGYDVVDSSLFLVIEDSDNTSGMVQFYVPPVAGKRLLIAGKTPIDQQLDITNASRFNGKSIETNFDKIVSMIQEFISSLDEEIRQRINNNEELRNKLDLMFTQYIADVDARFNSKWTEIADYLNATLPMFFCIMKKELSLYEETGLITAIENILESTSLSQLIDEYIASLDQDFVINTTYFSGAFGFDPSFVAAGGKYPLNAKLKLSNGDIVRSTVANNTVDPNIDMTGWVKTNSDNQIQTWSGRSQESKNKERVSLYDYGAIGDGVTDDTSKFKDIETTEAKTQIDLAGGVFAITSIDADPIKGVTLTKDYTNGTLLIDGKKRIFDKNQNFAMSAASFNRLGQPSSTKSLGLKRITENEYQIWRPLGGQYWQQAVLRRTANNVPLNWQDTYIKQVLGYICSEDGNTYSGTWATLDASTGVSSASDTTYIGGRARQSQTVGDYVEIPYVGGGDIYVVFVGRTSGNYVNVLLDGSKDYLTLPADGSDNRYFDTYTSTDLQFKQLVRIASGVPNGNHTIRLTLSASKNPASTGNRFMFNALAFDSAEFGPWRAQADAKAWKTSEVILLNQVRKRGSNYYYASVAGTTGLNPPTHTNGAVSDGGVTWTYRAQSGYDLVDTAIQVAGSQLEYAYEIKPDGATTSEDVGAALHGNEAQTALKISVNGNAVSMLNNTWLSGDFINIVESQYSTHSQIVGGATPIFETVLTRTFKRQWFEIHHKHTVKYKTECGYFYPHMWPLLHYHGVNGQKYVVDSLWSSGDGYRYAKDYYSQVNPIVGRTKDTLQVAYGQCLQPNGSVGVPSTQRAPLRFAAWLSVDLESVNSYSNANSVFSGKAMNISGVDVSTGGYSSDVVKMYFERYSKNKPKTLNVGDKFECFARYGLDIYSNS